MKWLPVLIIGFFSGISSVYAVDYFKMRLAADGYYWEKEEYPKKDMVLINLEVARNNSEWTKFVREKLPHRDPQYLGAFATIRTPAGPGEKGPECTIYTKNPEWIYEPEFVGHELLHCFYGNWHIKQDRSKR